MLSMHQQEKLYLIKKGKAAALCNIGIVYNKKGEYPKALDFYQKALKLGLQGGW